MKCSVDARARALLPLWSLLPIFLVFLGARNQLNAAEETDGGNVVAVEEDWELIVKEPDEVTAAPQVTCILAPTTQDSGVYAAFNLNHKSFPQYDAGGLHLQIWNNDTPLATAKFSDALLKPANEVITWTVRMSLHEGQVTFEIISGSSSTWGQFGGTGVLKTSVTSNLENLNQYRPEFSVTNSGVGFAGNRVTSLKLKAVRKLLKSEAVEEDNNSRTVYPQT
jgi:hypothetical protein